MVPPEIKKTVERIAAEREWSIAKTVRRLIERGLQQEAA
jgi:hypothetical protein